MARPIPITNPGAAHLHNQHNLLHTAPDVTHTVDYINQGAARSERIINEPSHKLDAYLGFLAANVNDGILTGDEESIDRQAEALAVPVTSENAQKYYAFQARIAREQGIDVPEDKVSDKDKQKLIETVHADQKTQLKGWAMELNSPGTDYPGWFKYYVFSNVTKLTAFNGDHNKKGQPKGFEKRSANSFVPYPELDSESVSLVYDTVKRHLANERPPADDDKAIAMAKVVSQKHNFADLYAKAQEFGFAITPELREITEGRWHRFEQSADPQNARRLAESVGRYRSSWCTAGFETAKSQLSKGDFYVFFSKNQQGEAVVPRVAIRMEDESIKEVRGIDNGKDQELEPELFETAMAKLAELPGGNVYFEKAEAMQRLTALEKSLKDDPQRELSPAETDLLYQITKEVKGFGAMFDVHAGHQEPRLKEIQEKRKYGEIDKPEVTRLLSEQFKRLMDKFDLDSKADAVSLSLMLPPEEKKLSYEGREDKPDYLSIIKDGESYEVHQLQYNLREEDYRVVDYSLDAKNATLEATEVEAGHFQRPEKKLLDATILQLASLTRKYLKSETAQAAPMFEYVKPPDPVVKSVSVEELLRRRAELENPTPQRRSLKRVLRQLIGKS